jgi:hypothetical protein
VTQTETVAGPSVGDATASPAPAPPPFRLLRRFLHLAGAAAAAAFALSLFHPEVGSEARVWPWQIWFAADGFSIGWDRAHAWSLLLGLSVVAGIAGAFLPDGRRRGAVVLVPTLLGIVAFYARRDGAIEDYAATTMAVALVAAGTLVAPRAGSGFASRALLLAGLLAVASQIFLPYPLRNELDMTGSGMAQQSAVAGWIQELEDPPEGSDPYGEAVEWTDVIRSPTGAAMGLILLVFAVGGIALLGLGGRWAGWVAGLGCLVLVAYPPVRFLDVAAPRVEEWPEGVRMAAFNLHFRLTAFLLPLTAAVADLLVAARRR